MKKISKLLLLLSMFTLPLSKETKISAEEINPSYAVELKVENLENPKVNSAINL